MVSINLKEPPSVLKILFQIVNWGLVAERHNDLRDGVADLVGKAFTTAHMPDNTIIFTGRSVRGGGGQRQINRESHGGTASGGRVVEGGPSNPGPLDSGGGQYSRHACRKY